MSSVITTEKGVFVQIYKSELWVFTPKLTVFRGSPATMLKILRASTWVENLETTAPLTGLFVRVIVKP